MGDAADGATSVIGSLAGWAKHPFTQQMDVWHWVLFLGLVLVISGFWLMILNELKGEL